MNTPEHESKFRAVADAIARQACGVVRTFKDDCGFWRCCVDFPDGHTIDPTGQAPNIWLRLDCDKIEAHGSAPWYTVAGKKSAEAASLVGYREKAPEAKVGIDRDPEAAARDIVRRVVTPYLPLWSAAVTKAHQWSTESNRRLATFRKVAEAFGCHHMPKDTEHSLYLPGEGSIQSVSAEHVEVKLRLTPGQAIRVAGHLASWKAEDAYVEA